jgi:folate-binding protein YgfZ
MMHEQAFPAANADDRGGGLAALQEEAGAILVPYGPVRVAAGFGELELEYAAIRKHCGLLHFPQRTAVEVRGSDHLDYLNRMLTQELKTAAEGQVRRSFWLNKKGRIEADLRVLVLPGRVLLDVDVHAATAVIDGLRAFIVMEEAEVHPAAAESGGVERLALHGPTAPQLIDAAFGAAPAENACVEGSIAGVSCIVWREDTAGVPGYELIVPSSGAVAVYRKLLELGHDATHGAQALRGDAQTLASRVRLRPIGWHAYNMARIEAGTPIFNIDFGPRSLPAETGIIQDRVSFTKGCYLGQEVVARMHARGAFKQRLVGLKFESTPGSEELPLLPAEGAELFPAEGAREEAVGAVTSSTLSPMLGAVPIAIAAVRYTHIAPGTQLVATVEGRDVRAVVQERLRFLAS